MRLWSLHPKYLDTQGLVALWREGLLAQKVLRGKTVGYRNHPQLERFKAHANPEGAIAAYLYFVWEESCRRGYCFDKSKLQIKRAKRKILVTSGQLTYEFKWLCAKLKKRALSQYRKISAAKKILPHSFFRVVKGPVESWERLKNKP